MTEKRPSNYRLFRISLHVDFDRVDLRDREHLSKLMKHAGYHLTGKNLETRSEPSPKQMEFAWSEMAKKYDVVPEKQQYIYVSAYSYKRGKKLIKVKKYRRKVRNV
jgi:hypothetical protein